MPIIVTHRGHAPKIAEGVFVAENATLIGQVELAERVNVWYGAVLRADDGYIKVGAGTNIQDLACLHLTLGLSNVEIGENVTLGHNCTVHGAKIGDGSLVGMGSVVLDNADVGAQSLIAAGSVVTPRTVIPPRSLVRGQPAKVVRELREGECEQGKMSALHYAELAKSYQ